MDLTVLTGFIIITLGVILVIFGLRLKNEDEDIESEGEEKEEPEEEIKEQEIQPPVQKKYGAEEVIDKMKNDEAFKKEVYNIIKKNKEREL